jgi:hypothetical protein
MLYKYSFSIRNISEDSSSKVEWEEKEINDKTPLKKY